MFLVLHIFIFSSVKKFSKMFAWFLFPLAMYKGLSCSTLGMACLFQFSHAGRCLVALTVALFCIFLMTKEIKHFFHMFFKLPICYPLWWNLLPFNTFSSVHFSIYFSALFLLICKNFQILFTPVCCTVYTRYLYYKYLLSICVLFFHSMNGAFWWSDVLNFNVDYYSRYFSLMMCFAHFKVIKISSNISFIFVVLTCTFIFAIHLQLT